MDKRRVGPNADRSLTRISVIGGRDYFVVRAGDAEPVRVWVERGELRCECGQTSCPHVVSLQMCGFVDSALGWQQAA